MKISLKFSLLAFPCRHSPVLMKCNWWLVGAGNHAAAVDDDGGEEIKTNDEEVSLSLFVV